MASNDNKERPNIVRKLRGSKVQFSTKKKTLHPNTNPSPPQPLPPQEHDSVLPKPYLMNLFDLNPPPPQSPAETHQDSRDDPRDDDENLLDLKLKLAPPEDSPTSPVVLNGRSEGNEINGNTVASVSSEKYYDVVETNDDSERQLKYFLPMKSNVPRYKNLPPRPPPSSPAVIPKGGPAEDFLVECAVNFIIERALKEYYANKRKNLPPPPKTHQDSPQSPVVVMNSGKRSKKEEERYEAIQDVVKRDVKEFVDNMRKK